MKNKNTAAFFALFLGWFGVHRFYLRQPGLGILYIILISTTLSFLLGIIDAIVLLTMDQAEFDRKYNNVDNRDQEHDRYQNRRERRDFRRSNRRRSTARENRAQSERPRSEFKRRETRERRRPEKKQMSQRPRINPYKQSGIKKYKDFDLQAAIEDFEKGLEMDPRDISLHFNIACAYSLTEQADKAFTHLSKAVECGLKDFKKIKTHDDLAFVRIQPKFEVFEANGFKEKREKPAKAETQQIEAPKENLLDDDLLLSQLNRLSELKKKNLITEKEFLAEKQKLIR